MHNLLVEIGNTATKASWADGMTLGKIHRYQGEKVFEFILSLLENDRADVIVLSSAREISRKWENVLSGKCGQLVLMDRFRTAVNEENSIPAWVTPDRAASIMAVRYLFRGKPVTVFDFGTIMSIDTIDADGNYMGGALSPGCRTRFKSIYRYSKSLPLIDTPEEIPSAGTALSTSIEFGVLSGIMFEIQGHLDSNPGNIAVFTGGDANYFAKKMKNSIFAVCNLVLMGLAIIAENKYETEKTPSDDTSVAGMC